MKIDALPKDETTPSVNAENPNREKPREPTDSRTIHYTRVYKNSRPQP